MTNVHTSKSRHFNTISTSTKIKKFSSEPKPAQVMRHANKSNPNMTLLYYFAHAISSKIGEKSLKSCPHGLLTKNSKNWSGSTKSPYSRHENKLISHCLGTKMEIIRNAIHVNAVIIPNVNPTEISKYKVWLLITEYSTQGSLIYRECRSTESNSSILLPLSKLSKMPKEN